MFDKEQYRKNRKAGKRGQGDVVGKRLLLDKENNPVRDEKRFATGQNMQRVAGQVMLLNRKDARKKVVDRNATKPNIVVRKKLPWSDRQEISARAKGESHA